MLFRNHFFDLKSDVPKINTNVMQLFNGIFEKKIITNNKFLNAYFERIPQLFKIQQRIKIKEKDICDVKQYNSVMPEFEKQKILNIRF
mgnify:CR=1 FL=1